VADRRFHCGRPKISSSFPRTSAALSVSVVILALAAIAESTLDRAAISAAHIAGGIQYERAWAVALGRMIDTRRARAAFKALFKLETTCWVGWTRAGRGLQKRTMTGGVGVGFESRFTDDRADTSRWFARCVSRAWCASKSLFDGSSISVAVFSKFVRIASEIGAETISGDGCGNWSMCLRPCDDGDGVNA
jgi:hypothetical protein